MLRLLTTVEKCIIMGIIEIKYHKCRTNRVGKERAEEFMTNFSRIALLTTLTIGTVLAGASCGTHKTLKEADVQEAVRTESVSTTESPAGVNDLSAPDEITVPFVVYPHITEYSKRFASYYGEKSSVLVDTDTNGIIAYRNENMRVYPASLTKVMTLIVAAEHITDLSETVLITDDMVIPMVERDASRAGFLPGETPSLLELLYGMILPSGADASLALAIYVSGSEEKFVELMNEKARSLGLKDTHFVNVTGLHDKDHYSTVSDVAVILEYAIRDDLCRRILTRERFRCRPTEQHPEGLEFSSTLLSRMSGDEMPGVTVLGGKTGFTDDAGNCVASFARTDDDKEYVLVLCGGRSNWDEIYNTLSAYSVYCAGGEPYRSARKDNKDKQ